jgi:UDP-N-acetylmuramate--L-alanine ligase
MRKASEIQTAFSLTDALDGRRSFFLVGIGGAGMSALARMLAHRGFAVRGTDSTAGPETQRLAEEGIAVRIGHSGKGLTSTDALVVTDAIDLDASPEVARARELNIPIVRRSQALGWVLKPYKTICITGTHGKTTTTGMIGAGLIAAGLDPTVVVGAAIPQWGGPVREGKGEWAVVEACEAYDSFHDLRPDMVVLTNLELDHVDFHGTWENLRDSVLRFVNRLPKGGALIANNKDDGSREIADAYKAGGGNSQYYAMGTWTNSGQDEWNAEPPHLALPGEHNLYNAAGAWVACLKAGADTNKALDGIAAFTGAERRLQLLHDGDVKVYDDYAHHPTEIEASLKALRERQNGRLIVVYQPHLYSRTAPLIDEFAAALSHADLVVLTDIYPAREAPMPGVSSARIAEKVTVPVKYIPSRHLLPREVAKIAKKGDVVVGMGAGNIAEFGPAFVKELERKDRRPKVAVLYGGDSAEREVSLHSGRAVADALRRKGHEVRLLDISEGLLSKGDVSALIGPDRPDVCFLAVHGTNAEDGAIQGLLQLLHLPYTGSCIGASSTAMDKDATKRVLEHHGIRVPKGKLVTNPDEKIDFEGPWVVKPNAQGSTVGISFVEDPEALEWAIARALAYDDAVLVEEWVRGMEISTPILGYEALPPVEIATHGEHYDFASKYLPGATEEIVPARLRPEILKEAQRIALEAHRALGCAGATRTDAIVRDPEGAAEIVVLEVNTLPGMTATSLLPNSAAAAGIPFDDLCERLVEEAMKRNAPAD